MDGLVKEDEFDMSEEDNSDIALYLFVPWRLGGEP